MDHILDYLSAIAAIHDAYKNSDFSNGKKHLESALVNIPDFEYQLLFDFVMQNDGKWIPCNPITTIQNDLPSVRKTVIARVIQDLRPVEMTCPNTKFCTSICRKADKTKGEEKEKCGRSNLDYHPGMIERLGCYVYNHSMRTIADDQCITVRNAPFLQYILDFDLKFVNPKLLQLLHTWISKVVVE